MSIQQITANIEEEIQVLQDPIDYDRVDLVEKVENDPMYPDQTIVLYSWDLLTKYQKRLDFLEKIIFEWEVGDISDKELEIAYNNSGEPLI